MEKKKLLKLSELTEDFTIYPRASVDAQHVQSLRWAIRAGSVLPPIIAESKSYRIVDGMHRKRAYQGEHGEDHAVEIVIRDYASDSAVFQDAMLLNSAHGRSLSPFDRAHAALRAKALRISTEKIAVALHTTTEAIEKICSEKTGKLRIAKGEKTGGAMELVPIKRTIAHMAGQVLTEKQLSVNEGLSGWPPLFYVNELIKLLENNMLDMNNGRLRERLVDLGLLLADLPPLVSGGVLAGNANTARKEARA